ncbi:hypothetical protein [Pendulispora albinea]|uniref:Uncharacterized protein n=1 Tax=Pendulispora albinea TaxID=2741071 RepID=A0ABZ2LQI5_9BACT
MDRATELPETSHRASLETGVLVVAFAVWVASVVRVVGTLAYQEPFGAEPTLALLMALLMSRLLVAPLASRFVRLRRRLQNR